MLVVMRVKSKREWAHRFVMSIAAARGIGNVGLAPQLLSLYPVWVLVLLNLAYWRMGKAEPSTAKISVWATSTQFILTAEDLGFVILETLTIPAIIAIIPLVPRS